MLIIKTLSEKCSKSILEGRFNLVIASRSSTTDLALQLIEMFELINNLDSIQIYTDTKLKHLKNIKQLKIESFNDILFFDDHKSNLQQTESFGVVGWQVRRHYGSTQLRW